MREERRVPSQIKRLIAIHLIVGIAPVAMFTIQSSMWMLPVVWALSSLSIAQLLLLSLWIGMSGNKWIVRLAGACGGIAYVTLWPALAQYVSPYSEAPESSFASTFLAMLASYAALVLVFSSCFVVMRRRGMSLVDVAEVTELATPPRTQYSVFHLLVVMSTCSLLLSLAKLAQSAEQTPTGFSTLAFVAGIILMLVVFVLNGVCSAWATLSLHSPRNRILFAFGVALLLGVAFAVSTGNFSMSWWVFIWACLIPVLSTAVVVLSLLVVRSCGYRLCRESIAVGIE